MASCTQKQLDFHLAYYVVACFSIQFRQAKSRYGILTGFFRDVLVNFSKILVVNKKQVVSLSRAQVAIFHASGHQKFCIGLHNEYLRFI